MQEGMPTILKSTEDVHSLIENRKSAMNRERFWRVDVFRRFPIEFCSRLATADWNPVERQLVLRVRQGISESENRTNDRPCFGGVRGCVVFCKAEFHLNEPLACRAETQRCVAFF